MGKSAITTLAMLHEHGWVSFWAQNDGWQFTYAFKLNDPAQKIVVERSSRYLASLTEGGSVEVWRLKGADAKFEWELQFKSVTDIVSNTTIENQFFVQMSSLDSEGSAAKQDSLLLFQFSRPQNLVKFWKFKIELTRILFMDTDPSVLLTINKNGEMQRLYCCESTT